jgi:hypothetical protein
MVSRNTCPEFWIPCTQSLSKVAKNGSHERSKPLIWICTVSDQIELSRRLPGGRCCLERTLLTLIEKSDVCVGFVCWLRLDFVLVLFVLVFGLGALGSLSLLTIQSVCYPRPFRLYHLLSRRVRGRPGGGVGVLPWPERASVWHGW